MRCVAKRCPALMVTPNSDKAAPDAAGPAASAHPPRGISVPGICVSRCSVRSAPEVGRRWRGRSIRPSRADASRHRRDVGRHDLHHRSIDQDQRHGRRCGANQTQEASSPAFSSINCQFLKSSDSKTTPICAACLGHGLSSIKAFSHPRGVGGTTGILPRKPRWPRRNANTDRPTPIFIQTARIIHKSTPARKSPNT